MAATNEAEELRFRIRQEGVAHIQTLCPDIRVVHMHDTIHDIPLQRPALLAKEILMMPATPHKTD